jgi:DNA-binding transcriptional MerR regulator
MTQYSIDQFSKITGFSKYVLRTWENRYGFLKPLRTKTKIRLYSDTLLVSALNANYLLQNGYKISDISKLNHEEVTNKISKLEKQTITDTSHLYYISKLIDSAIHFNSNLFHRSFDEGLEKFTLVEFYLKVILPTLNKIGVLWLTSRINPAQEHFLSELIKQKIFSAIERNKVDEVDETWLLFLPENEFHDLGLIIAKFLLTSMGYNVIYLGANVPLQAINALSNIKINNILYFSIARIEQETLNKTITYIESSFKKSKLYLVTNRYTQEVSKIGKTHIIHTFEEFFKVIK